MHLVTSGIKLFRDGIPREMFEDNPGANGELVPYSSRCGTQNYNRKQSEVELVCCR
jgi:hypothetical protein